MAAVKWGVISTADIGMKKVLPGMMKSPDIEIVAIASRWIPSMTCQMVRPREPYA